MLTENDVNELLKKYTEKQLIDRISSETSILDYRANLLVSHLWIELLFNCLIVKKFKNHDGIIKFDFSKKQKILFGLGIIDENINHDLKILNNIRNEFAHELYPLQGKTPNLIKKFKMYPKNEIKEENLLTDGVAFGMITATLTMYLVKVLWDTQSKGKKK